MFFGVEGLRIRGLGFSVYESGVQELESRVRSDWWSCRRVCEDFAREHLGAERAQEIL